VIQFGDILQKNVEFW